MPLPHEWPHPRQVYVPPFPHGFNPAANTWKVKWTISFNRKLKPRVSAGGYKQRVKRVCFAESLLDYKLYEAPPPRSQNACRMRPFNSFRLWVFCNGQSLRLQLWSKVVVQHTGICVPSDLQAELRASILNQSQPAHACPRVSTPELVTVWSGWMLEVPRFCVTVARVRSHIWEWRGMWRGTSIVFCWSYKFVALSFCVFCVCVSSHCGQRWRRFYEVKLVACFDKS